VATGRGQMPIAARYRGPDRHEVEAVVQEIRRLELLMKRWAEGPPILLAVGDARATPAELVRVLGAAAEPWERARQAWDALRRFEAELPVKSREVAELLVTLRRAVACALGPEEARRILSRPKRVAR